MLETVAKVLALPRLTFLKCCDRSLSLLQLLKKMNRLHFLERYSYDPNVSAKESERP